MKQEQVKEKLEGLRQTDMSVKRGFEWLAQGADYTEMLERLVVVLAEQKKNSDNMALDYLMRR